MTMKAAGAMTRQVICIKPTDPLNAAHALMNEWGIRHLPVLEHGRLVGILSDRDVLMRAAADPAHGPGGALRVPAVEVAQAMTTHPITCRPASSVSYVAGLMVEYKIDSVPVTDAEGRLVGLVTSTDLLQLLRDRGEEAHQIIPFEFHLRTDLRATA